VTRSHRRRLVVPAVAAALALPTALLAACSAGQLAATSLVQSAVPGGQASIQAGTVDETIQVANATIDYNGPKGYAAGGDAPLSLWIFNNTAKDITLTGVSSNAGQVVVADGAAPGAPSACQSSARPIQANPSTGAPNNGVAPSMGASGGISPQGPTSTPSANTSPKPTSSAQESASANPSGSATPSGTPLAVESSAPAGSSEIQITVKSDGCVALTKQGSQFLQVSDLSDPVVPGKTVNLSLTFQQAGGKQFVIGTTQSPFAVPVDVPGTPDPRSSAAAPAATE
jgi:copper(I)-binding protein